MTRPLGLHHVTAINAEPLEFIAIAAASGCDRVSLFTHSTQAVLPGQKSRLLFPTVTPDISRAVMDRLADNGIRVLGVEYFPITAEARIEDYAAGLALGRELGANRAVTHIHDVDSARAMDKLGQLCDVAAAEGLAVGIEFTGLTRGCLSMARAAWFVDQVGRANIGIGVDMLHLVRTGGTADDVAKLDARYFSYGQICDGHGLHSSSDYMSEAHERELPGAGDFPLVEILSALPESTPLEVEVPSEKRHTAGMPALDHVRDVVSRTRALLLALTPTR